MEELIILLPIAEAEYSKDSLFVSFLLIGKAVGTSILVTENNWFKFYAKICNFISVLPKIALINDVFRSV